MPAYNFKFQFVAPVESGHKRCTIRGKAPKVGDTAYLYTGMRTKACRKLGDGVVTKVTSFSISQVLVIGGQSQLQIFLDGERLLLPAIQALAIKDGFGDATGFIDFFLQTYGSTFHGYLIEWELVL